MPVRFALIALAATLPTVALAQDNAAAPADATPVKVKKICRREVTIGSAIPHSTCHSKEEWASIDANARTNAADSIATQRQGGR